MKLIALIAFTFSILQSATVVDAGDMFAKSTNCKSCHLPIVNEWKESWHSKSHYKHDEYFKKSIDYVSKKSRKSLNGVKVECATCHNPRIAVTSTDEEYEIDAVMGLDKGSKVDKALADDAISEGINCVVCHNIDKINCKEKDSIRGINRIEWTKSGVMSGPYSDAKSPYHKVQHRDFMSNKSNKLCYVCHANDRSIKNVVFANTQEEYAYSQTLCVECHMGKKRLSVASTLKIDHGKAKKRKIRTHGFRGAHFDDMIKGALTISAKQKSSFILITLKNKLPHNVPTGFGSREILVELSYLKGKKEIKKESISLTTHYKDRRKRATIPHLAKTSSKNMSIPAKGQKILKVKKVKGATSVNISIYYRLVNDEVRSLLKLKDAIWVKKSPIVSKKIKLK